MNKFLSPFEWYEMILYLIAKIIKKVRLPAIFKSRVHRLAKIEAGSTLVRTKFERHSFCGYDCCIADTSVGAFTSIGTRVTIGGAIHPMHFLSTSPVFLSHPDSIRTKLARHTFLPIINTIIGADVWIGDGVFVKAGVTIGVGAVVGMGSVVTHDVGPYAVVAGNPAKLIRFRFDEALIQRLIASQWWTLPDSQIAKAGHHAQNPDKFLDYLLKS